MGVRESCLAVVRLLVGQENLFFKEERDFSNMTTQNELHCTIPVHLLIRVAQEWLTTWGPHKVALGCEIPVLIFEKRKPVQNTWALQAYSDFTKLL